MKEVRGADGKALQRYVPTMIGQGRVRAETHRVVMKGLDEVVNAPHGTGRRAQVPGVHVGGKSGSAENPHGETTHAWFAAVAPLEAPEIAVAVILENGGGGGAKAAPICSKVIEAYFKGKGNL
jgi:penicillin-binding protein 2